MAREEDAHMEEVDANMEEVRDWSVLPADMVLACANLVDCNVDRMNMVGQCRAWLRALGVTMRPKQLPWMLVPYRRTSWLNPNVISRAHMFCFLSQRAHKLPLPSSAYTARYIGSYEGGWFIVAFGQTSGYAVLNLHSGVSVNLPNTILASPLHNGCAMVMRAAALSGDPSAASSCVVAAICTTLEPQFLARSFLAFSRVEGTAFTCANEFDVEDVIYHNKSFYSITRLDDLLICTPDFNKTAPPDSLNIERTYRHFLPIHHEDDFCVKGRYLVRSRGELLLVMRYASMLTDQTSSFALFRMSSGPIISSGPYYAWERLDDLDGRMVFVGKGNSRSYEASEFSQCKPGVYFHDDDVFNMPEMIGYGFHGRKFPCFDNGCWPGPYQQVKKWYEWRLASTYTSPIWYLH